MVSRLVCAAAGSRIVQRRRRFRFLGALACMPGEFPAELWLGPDACGVPGPGQDRTGFAAVQLQPPPGFGEALRPYWLARGVMRCLHASAE